MNTKIDVKKVLTNPKDQWEAIDAMVKAESKLITAMGIMKGILDFPEEEHMEFHLRNIENFLAPYLKTENTIA